MKNWRQTVLSQFALSPRLVALLDSINDWISPDANFELFYQQVWNLDTAGPYGLDVWARIVNVPTTITGTEGYFFGFGEAGDRVGFGQAPFGDNYTVSDINFALTGNALKRFILAKAAYNITDGSVPAINAILMNILFQNRGNAYVTDGANNLNTNFFGFGEAQDRVGFDQAPFGDNNRQSGRNMTLTYVFDFVLQPYEKAMVQSGVLPKPTGVQAYWQFVAPPFPPSPPTPPIPPVSPSTLFGFGEALDRLGFNQGPFGDYLAPPGPPPLPPPPLPPPPPPPVTSSYFGFGEAGDRVGFDQGPFSD